MTMPSFDFATLTPDLILDAIESTGLKVNSGLLELNSYENRVYQFLDDDGRRYVVKLYRPQRWSLAQIQEEHRFALELAEAEIPVVAPLGLDGATVHAYQGILFALFPSVGGRSFEVDNLDQLEWVGRYLGRIHAVGRRRPFSCRPILGCEEFVEQSRRFLGDLELIPQALRPAFFSALDTLADVVIQRYRPKSEGIRLHGDVHPGNILWRDGPLFVDLDDCRQGPAVQDLWMMLSGARRDQLLQLDLLLEGYQQFADFDRTELALIEPLRAMRIIHYMAWIGRRWSDAAFPHAFPWFSTEAYWQQQIGVLTEQLQALEAPPLGA